MPAHEASETQLPFNPGELPPPPRRAVAANVAPALPDYELGEEIGRGGMGVVYRARDRRLDRVVAVKFVLSGACAGRDERERFLAEGRVTARLQHPNIVQVFEVGDAGGVPYMVLELVEGGTLARAVAGAPLSGGHAAALVEPLARAVAYAHARGVIHRDLKPGNILLENAERGTRSAELEGKDTERMFSLQVPSSAFRVKIADFGLAKQLGDDSQRTRTGMIVGTPSYMAPEQVAEHGTLGPAVDIYALGAILYELLTGRPPFRAASAIETLDLVRERPPVPPAVLQPGLARDLNTICLKCLEKDPAKRYASAAALADDLSRFRDGRPILARPIGPAERAWRWARRNPRVAGLVGALAVALAAGGAGVFWQWRRAEKNFATAEKNFTEAQKQSDAAGREREAAVKSLRDLERAVEDMRYLIGVIDNDQLFHLRMEPPRKELLTPALRANREFIAEHGDDPEREPEVVSAHYRVALLTRLVGTRAEALAAGRKALDLQLRFVESHPDVTQYRRDLAASYHNVGFLIHSGCGANDSEDALPYLRHARLLREEFVDAQPDNLDYCSELAGCLNDLGLAHYSLGQHRQADEELALAADHQGRAFDRAPHVRRYRVLLANHVYNRARCQIAMKRYAEAVTLAERLPELLPDEADTHIRYARVLALTLAARGQPPSAADDLLGKAMRSVERADALDPDLTAFWVTNSELQALDASPDFRALRDRARAGRNQDAPRLANAPRQ